MNKAVYAFKLKSFGEVARSLEFKITDQMKQSGVHEWPDRIPHNIDGQMDS